MRMRRERQEEAGKGKEEDRRKEIERKVWMGRVGEG